MSRTFSATSEDVSTAPWELEPKGHAGVAGYAVILPHIWRKQYLSRRSMEQNDIERSRIEWMLLNRTTQFFTKKWHAEDWIRSVYKSEDATPFDKMLMEAWKKNGWEFGIVPIRFAVATHAISRSP